jgi:hypothetical protein
MARHPAERGIASEGWEDWNKNLKALELAAPSTSGPQPKDEPRKLDSIEIGDDADRGELG